MITCLVVDRDRRWNGYGYIFISFRVEPVARSTVRRWILYEERVRIFVSSTRLIRPRVVATICLLTRFFFPLCTISHKNCRRERKPAGQKHTWQPQTFSPCMHVGYHEGLARRGQCHDHVDLVQKLYPPSERFPGSKSRRTVRCSFLLFNYYHFFFIRIWIFKFPSVATLSLVTRISNSSEMRF